MSETARYFNLSTPAPRRLAMMREALAQHATRYPHCPEHVKPHSWRDIRGTTHKAVSDYIGALSRGVNDGAPVWYCHTGEYFRNERWADDIDGSGIRHTGWYCDAHQSETARGIVGRLPHGRFIAGYWLSMNGERVYFPGVFDDEGDAARMADEHARVIAENEAEYSAKGDAARNLESETEDKVTRLRELLALRNHKRFPDARDDARELISEIREARETLETEYADFI